MTTEMMDVMENTVETMAEPVADVVNEIDWSKYGLIGAGIGVVAVGALAVYKLGPKVIERGRNWKIERNVRKQEKQEGEFVTVKKYDVKDVEEETER